ncbi:MerR family transcriptional regulator [Nitrolancea hollandica]|uniref:Putative Transcriptional regulator, MerR family n=1 Tax=Nitrolancea hollandica Lb TaxID=1129897 RepID=I4EKR8_9BACT|nr:MerR family transcriptional regulator [Nitrolancea hollandica]CCF85280.1 putative Transcriptional regulator, MerR family [Nitrolancea hollandica Lb]
MAENRVGQSNEALRPIGAVAREVGLTPRAIRYYEEIGLLRPAVRVKGADRLFDESDVQRLRQIKRMRDVIGFTLAEIRELLDTDDVRAQLRTQFRGTSDPRVRREVLQTAIRLAEQRLGIVERKLEQVESVRSEELSRLARLRRLLAEEEAREEAAESHSKR